MQSTIHRLERNATVPTKAASWFLVSFLAVFLPAVAVRLAFLYLIDTPILFFKYPYFAEKLAAGESIGTRLADLSPFYLYLLTIFRWLSPADWAFVKVLQAIVGAANCWLTAGLGKVVFGSRAIGVLAGLGMAAYGNLVILETTLEPTVFVLLFNLLATYFLYRHFDPEKARGKKGNRYLLLSALFTGLAVVTEPSFLLFVPLAVLWIVLQQGRTASIAQILTGAVLFGVTAGAPILSVTLRKHVLLEDKILVTADAGKVFLHGNSRDATALRWAGIPDQGFIEEVASEPDYAHAAFRELASRLSGRELKPSESSQYWARRTLTDISADPARYARLLRDKLLFFFTDYELHYIASAYQEYKTSRAYPVVRFAWIVPLGILGMLVATNRFVHLLPLYGLVFLYLLSGLIFIVQSRYRLPAVPYLCLFGAFAITRLSQWLLDRRVGVTLASLVFLASVYQLSTTALQAQINATDLWFQATKTHYELEAQGAFRKGQHARAVAAANRALTIAPDFAPAYNLRGKSYALMGNHSSAIEDFKKIIQLHPNHPEGYRNLGFAYLLNNDKTAARMYLEKSLAMMPEDKKVREAVKRLNQSTNPTLPDHP